MRLTPKQRKQLKDDGLWWDCCEGCLYYGWIDMVLPDEGGPPRFRCLDCNGSSVKEYCEAVG